METHGNRDEIRERGNYRIRNKMRNLQEDGQEKGNVRNVERKIGLWIWIYGKVQR